MWIAITGGCGYIGSHVALYLKDYSDYKVLIIDKQTHSNISMLCDKFIHDDFVGLDSMNALKELKPVAIIHCAASSLVGPSVSDPKEYYHNNVVKNIAFFDFLKSANLNNVIFSSSAAVYGDAQRTCDEYDDLDPINPYGRTKSIIEFVLHDYYNAYDFNSISLRFFNVAGADTRARIGPKKDDTHLIARVIQSVINKEKIIINGYDFQTDDGTCVRDYVNVIDVARAHLRAIHRILDYPVCERYNIGSGEGTSNLEIIKAVERVTDNKVDFEFGEKRDGDPAVLISSINRAKIDLYWTPHYRLDGIISTEWNWHNK